MKRLIAFVLLVSSATLLRGQQPTFRVQVDAIELDAFVTDARGNPVTGLTASDFQILEDGKPQVITSFSQVDIPFERQMESLAAQSTESDVQSNDHTNGRVYVFALDTVGTDLALRTRMFLRRFLEQHFAANDRAAVVSLGQQNGAAAQMLTNNRQLLLAAIDRFTGIVPSEDAPGAVDDNPLESTHTSALLQGFAVSKATETRFLERDRMAGLRSVAETMAGMRGRRKALLLFSSGLPQELFRALTYTGGVMTLTEQSAHAAVMAATRGNVAIYPIDPRGLTADGGAENDAPAIRDTSSDDAATNGTKGLDDRMTLSSLAQATGGFSLFSSNSFDTAFDRIVRENSTYYLLGFTSSNERRDGHHRKLEVRVTRPGLRVRARDGYVAPLNNEHMPERTTVASLSATVSNAIVNPLADATVPIRLFAAPFRRDGKNMLVALAAEIDPAALDLVERDGMYSGQLEIAFLATDVRARVYSGEHYKVNLALKSETYNIARQQGLRILSQIDLPPGRYQLHFAAGNPSGKAGNVVYDLAVPDFTKEPLMLSGIALTSASMSGAATVGPKDPLRGLLPKPATTRRDFNAGDTLALFGEVYENGKAPEGAVDVRVELRAEDGRVVRRTNAQDKRFTVDLPLAGVAAGNYIIDVSAHSTAGAQTASRDIPMRVR